MHLQFRLVQIAGAMRAVVVFVLKIRGEANERCGSEELRSDVRGERCGARESQGDRPGKHRRADQACRKPRPALQPGRHGSLGEGGPRSEEHTSELQSLMRISYAVLCLKKKNKKTITEHEMHTHT